MQSNHFNFMGRSSSIAGFYEGYGMSMILVMLFVSVLLWLQSGVPSKPVLVLAGVFLLAFGVTEYIYFFPFAAAFSLLAGLCTLLALRKAV
jgi:multidrug efflux pump subunit AcrB